MLFFYGADGDAELIGDFLMRKEFDFTEEQHRAAAGRKVGDGGFQLSEFLAGHDLLDHAGER